VPAAVKIPRCLESPVETLVALRARIAKIEGHTQSLNVDVETEAWTSGLTELDAALGGAFRLGALHEIMPKSPVDLPVASAFAFGLIARLPRRGPIFWCMSRLTTNEHGAPYAPGLTAFGINPARIINAVVHHPRDLAFVLEEAARLSSLAAIVAEGPLPSFTASRRLALLLTQSRVPLLFLADSKTGEGSAAATRFVISPLAVPVSAFDSLSPGPPAFNVTLARTRSGRPGLPFQTVFDHANLTFTSLSGSASDNVPNRQFPMGDEESEQRYSM
jgi:protein ImuA